MATIEEEKSSQIVEAILSDLKDRGGFDGFWDGIDDDLQEEIVEELTQLVSEILLND